MEDYLQYVEKCYLLLGALRAQLSYLEDTIDTLKVNDLLDTAYLNGLSASLLNAYREIEIIDSKGE